MITIYHNPKCGTSRNTLALIRNAGIEPHIVEYLKTPLNKSELEELVAQIGVPVRELMRKKESQYVELQLDDSKWTPAELIELMVQHPILMNRPIVKTNKGTRLCRPSEEVLDLLEMLNAPQRGAFTKEDGEKLIDENGHRIIR